MASFRVRYGVNTRRAQARGSQGYPKPFLRMAGCKSNVILILHGQKTKVSTITYRSFRCEVYSASTRHNMREQEHY
jgi:hypothetical protein